MDYKQLGERLRQLRDSLGLTQEECAQVLGTVQNAYHYYETGKRKISLPDLEKMAKFFGVSMAYLLGEVDQELEALDNLMFYNYRGLTPQQKESLLSVVRSLREANEAGSQ